MQIEIEIKNIDKILKSFQKAPAITAKEIDIALKKSILVAQSDSRSRTPVDKGFLRGNQPEDFPSFLTARLSIKQNYAIFVHEGTRFMKSRPWLKQTVAAQSGRINGFFDQALQNVIKQI